MKDKIITTLETIGAILILVAFTIYNFSYKLSDICFWAASGLFVPVIIWKHRGSGLREWAKIVLCFALYVWIGLFWFNGPLVKIKIPKLPPITMTREA